MRDPVHLIAPTSATTTATNGLADLFVHEKEVGKGELNNATSWDDFPNGRFGDFKSPAFDIQGLWGGVSIPVSVIIFACGLLLHRHVVRRSSTMGSSEITLRSHSALLGLPQFFNINHTIFACPSFC